MTGSGYQGRTAITIWTVRKLTRDEENVNDTDLYNKKKIENDTLTGSALTESGHVLAQLFRVLSYKPIGGGFDSVL
jgi:hypothetical protein